MAETLVGDASRLRQILLNLIGNAVKFRSVGGIDVDVRLVNQSNTQTSLTFCVSDSGIGIAQEKHRCIFDAFTQVDGSFTPEFGGTGLGLAICTQLVTLMNGKIWVESELGQGSRFYFTATFEDAAQVIETGCQSSPAAITSTAGAGPTPDSTQSPLRILVVEDNLVNQRLAMRLLQKQGHRVTVANNGREAIQFLEQSNWEFDCIFMDIQMPEMDGLEATKAIRGMESSRKTHMPIIALTAHAMEHDQELCFAAGMDRHLAKPIQTELLLAVLREVAAGALGCAVVK